MTIPPQSVVVLTMGASQEKISVLCLIVGMFLSGQAVLAVGFWVSRGKGDNAIERAHRLLLGCIVPTLAGLLVSMFLPGTTHSISPFSLVLDHDFDPAMRGILGGFLVVPLLGAGLVIGVVRAAGAPRRAATLSTQLLALAMIAAMAAESTFLLPELRMQLAPYVARVVALVLLVASFFRKGWRRQALATAALLISPAPLLAQLMGSVSVVPKPDEAPELLASGGMALLGLIAFGIGLAAALVALPSPESRPNGRSLPALLLLRWGASLAVLAGVPLGVGFLLQARFSVLVAPKQVAESQVDKLDRCLRTTDSTEQRRCCDSAIETPDGLSREDQARYTNGLLRLCLPRAVEIAATEHASAQELEREGDRLLRACKVPSNEPGHLDKYYLNVLFRVGSPSLTSKMVPLMRDDPIDYRSVVRVLRDHGEFESLKQATTMPSRLDDRALMGHIDRGVLLGLLAGRTACKDYFEELARAVEHSSSGNYKFLSEFLAYPMTACGADLSLIGDKTLASVRTIPEPGKPGIVSSAINAVMLLAYEAETSGARRSKKVSVLDFLRHLDPPLQFGFVSSAARAFATPFAPEDLDAITVELPPPSPGGQGATEGASTHVAPQSLRLAVPRWLDPVDVLYVGKHECYGYSFPDSALPPVDPAIALEAIALLDAYPKKGSCSESEDCKRRQKVARELAWLLRVEVAAELLRRGEESKAIPIVAVVESTRPSGAPLLTSALWLAANRPQDALRCAEAELAAAASADISTASYAKALSQVELGNWSEAFDTATTAWQRFVQVTPIPSDLDASERSPDLELERSPLFWLLVAIGIHEHRPAPEWLSSPSAGRCPIGSSSRGAKLCRLRGTLNAAHELWQPSDGTQDEVPALRDKARRVILSAPVTAATHYLLGTLTPQGGSCEVWLSAQHAPDRREFTGASRSYSRARLDAARWRGDKQSEDLWRTRHQAMLGLAKDQRSALLAALLGL